MIGRREIFFRARFAFFHTHASLLTSFVCSLSYFILAVPMRKRLGKHSCMSSPFPIAILNGTFFFRSVKEMNNWKRSTIKQILLLLLLYYCSHAALPSIFAVPMPYMSLCPGVLSDTYVYVDFVF